MEHLAKLRKEDPFEFRMKNMDPSNGEIDSLKNIISQLKISSAFDERQRQVKYNLPFINQILFLQFKN